MPLNFSTSTIAPGHWHASNDDPLQYFTYYIESLARDDKVRKIEPLRWSKVKALLSRLYDTSNPAQSLGLYVERIMYWKNPPETMAWFTVSSGALSRDNPWSDMLINNVP